VRVLFLSPRESWPATSGARLRDFHFARALAARSELTYIFFAADPGHSALASHLIQAKRVLAIASPRKYTPAKILRGALGRLPLPVQNYTSPEMWSAVESALRSEPFDIVHLDSIHLAAYLDLVKKHAPHARTVLDWHNIESELMQRYAMQQSSSLLRRIYARLTAGSLRRLESAMLQTCFGHIVCSQREQIQLSARQPQARVEVMVNGVDTERFRATENSINRNRLVFVGQMSYHANIEGIAWFAREIWPAVRKRHPQLVLSVVGSDPAPVVLALRSQDGIEVTGTVPDVLPYYQSALASIVPLQTGGGTRLKILEAMAAGAPVISTAPGAEGLNVTDGSDILLVGKGVGSWLAAIDIVLGQRRAELISAARQLACAQYDWNTIGDRLAATYEGWAATLRAAPRQGRA
jgi:glycosyltransferase involved in cell wall biosynthesis